LSKVHDTTRHIQLREHAIPTQSTHPSTQVLFRRVNLRSFDPMYRTSWCQVSYSLHSSANRVTQQTATHSHTHARTTAVWHAPLTAFPVQAKSVSLGTLFWRRWYVVGLRRSLPAASTRYFLRLLGPTTCRNIYRHQTAATCEALYRTLFV
jgi:hypothetical protein